MRSVDAKADALPLKGLHDYEAKTGNLFTN